MSAAKRSSPPPIFSEPLLSHLSVTPPQIANVKLEESRLEAAPFPLRYTTGAMTEEYFYDPHSPHEATIELDGNSEFAIILVVQKTKKGREMFSRWHTSPHLHQMDDDQKSTLGEQMAQAIDVIRRQAALAGITIDHGEAITARQG